MISDDRMEELERELEGNDWDAVLLNETWREQKEEFDELESGNLWMGSGGSRGKHGVGILLHKRWANFKPSWTAINQRLGYMDLNIGKWRATFVVAYMPHTGYQDWHIQHMYDSLTEILQKARQRRREVYIVGDWNAEVSHVGEHEAFES
eukprot:11648205-Karenia_brevis.AAC.1